MLLTSQVFLRCIDADCRKRTNLLTLQTWVPCTQRLGTKTTPSRLLLILRGWVATGLGKPPSAYPLARSVGSTWKPVKAVLEALQQLEANAGRARNDTLRLRGTVEVDATSVRLVRVYRKTTRLQEPVQRWLDAHPHTARPHYWLLHYRLVGAVQRSNHTNMVVRLLQHKVVPAGAKPPPEALLPAMTT